MTDETRAVSMGDQDTGNSVEPDENQNASAENGSIAGDQEQPAQKAVSGDLDISQQPKISDDALEYAKSKGWNGPEDFEKAIDSYRNLEQEYSRTDLSLKEGDLTDDDWNEFRKRSGAPDEPDTYELKAPDDMPDYVMYDDDMLSKFKTASHKVGLNPQQFSELSGIMQEHMIETQVQGHMGQLDRVEDTGATLRNEWKNDAVLEHNLTTSFQSINAHQGLKEAYIKAGLLAPVAGQPGKFNPTDPAIVMYHAEIGKQMQTESTGFGGIAAQTQIGSSNPFKEGDGWNETHQATLVREDPQRARALITQAGQNPSDYF
jgi:hypothetical protein